MQQASEQMHWDKADDAAAGAIKEAFAATHGPIFVGLAGAQGSGKSTMAPRVVARLSDLGLRAAVLSLDDFYLTRAERLTLARSVHPLLATRGVPGTHDLALLGLTLDALLAACPVAVPRFDKSADDRLAADWWPTFNSPFDVVLLEGWCVGARPQRATDLVAPANALERNEDRDGRWRRWVNDRLAGDYATLFKRLALRIFLRAPTFDVVLQWRREQEDGLARQRGEPGMTEIDLRRFVAHYERITRWMLEDKPAELVIELDRFRVPLL